MKVPNQHPKLDPGTQRLAIIGQSPGEREVQAGRPFCGPSGDMLDGLLGHAGISRDLCFVGNVSQVRPKVNNFNTFAWEGPEVQEGILQLRQDLEAFRPTMVLCLGNEALHLMACGNVRPVWDKRKREHVWPRSISSWRGSLFESGWLGREECKNVQQIGAEEFQHVEPCYECNGTGWLHGVKTLATYHPAALLRSPDLIPYVKADLRRVVQELKVGPGLALPWRRIEVITSFPAALDAIKAAHTHSRNTGEAASADSEGWCSGITHFGWSFRPDFAQVVSFVDSDNNSIFTFDEEVVLWDAFKDWMEDEAAPKILQNYLSDAFILAWTYGIVLRGLQHDTLALAWEADCELDKGLAVLASLYTREPFWKSRENYRDRLAWVCGMDAAVTLEVAQVLLRKVYGNTGLTQSSGSTFAGPQHPQREPQCLGAGAEAASHAGVCPQLNGGDPGEDRAHSFGWLQRPRDHYEFNLGLLPAALDVELVGWAFDKEKAKGMLADLEKEMFMLQAQIDREAGVVLTSEAIFEKAKAQFTRKGAKVKVEVVEERWQPMRWNGKKWVKDGKLTADCSKPCFKSEATMWGIWEVEPTEIDLTLSTGKKIEPPPHWLKPMPKLVKRSAPAPLDTWDDLEKHCKPKSLPALRRVRALATQLDLA